MNFTTPKLAILICLITLNVLAHSQNIYSALHHNENPGYKFGKPTVIVETNTFYSKTTQVDINTITFDLSGLPLTVETRDENNLVKSKLTYVNDTIRHLKLQRVLERWTNSIHTKEVATYSYDNQNFLVKIVDADVFGNPTMVSQIVNNERGHPIELRLYDGAGNPFGVEKAEYFYDKNIAVSSVYSADGRKLSTDTLRLNFQQVDTTDRANYNDHGDALSYKSTRLNGSVYLYEMEYVYDKVGNCIDEKIYRVTVKSNGKKKRELDRHFQKEITYR